jgi:hypothetical protein
MKAGVQAHMRIVLLLIVICAAGWAHSSFGTWKMNAARSTFTGGTRLKSLTVRIEPHAKGEVFTLDRTEADGRTTTSSTILYFDNTPRDFQDFGCSGTQSSSRIDSETVEILRNCGDESIRFIRRPRVQPNELILDVTEQHLDGRRFDRRLVLEKQ